MVASFLILFREVLEISVILSIVLAATRGIAGRGFFVWLGIAGGVVGSVLVALFAEGITNALEGMGQEIFNGCVLLLAAFMIAWTTIWMQTHGREMSQKLKHVGNSVREGSLPLYSVSVVVALSMWREGAEIALFMAGIISTSKESLLSIMSGAVAGACVAAVIGLLIYMGLITLSSRYLFRTVSWLLTLLAAGMAAAGAGYLVSADMLPVLVSQVWDSSHLLSEGSILGKVLHAMLGYSERPTGIQLVFYVGTLAAIMLTLRTIQAKKLQQKPL
jgi:high-affinity iron transporter